MRPAPPVRRDPAVSGPPAAGFVTLYQDPGEIAGIVLPTPCEAPPIDDWKNPYGVPATLEVQGVALGVVPAEGVVVLSGLAPGCYVVAFVPAGRGGAERVLGVR